MANHLKMAQVHAIQVLRTRGWSFRRIARELGVHRDTVARYVRLAEAGAEPSNLPTGCADQNRPNPPDGADLDPVDQGLGGQNRPNPPAGYSGPLSRCEPLRQAIIDGLDQGLSAQRIWQDLRADHGFEGGYDSVKRFVRRLRSTRPLPFRRMECQPGEEAQIDFGSGAPVVRPDGKRKRTHVFRIVLSHSRSPSRRAVSRIVRPLWAIP